MNLKADLFPYPVLTPELDDYLDNNSFDAQINVNPEAQVLFLLQLILNLIIKA